MVDSNHLLVVAHPVLTGIGMVEIDRAISKSRRTVGFDYVEIAPLRTTLAEQYDLDWAAAREAQERLFLEKLRPHLEGREEMAYFGFAPVPLAIHLGYCVQSTIKIDVYQRHHERQDWSWTPSGNASTRSFLEPIRLPERGSSEPGAVIIRVSTSARIAPKDTEEVVPKFLAAVDIELSSPHLDALETRGALDGVVAAFSRVLTRIRDLFPNLTTIHLFAAVPVGLAFRLGSRINPTMNPDVVTYQYEAGRTPRYRKAITLGLTTPKANAGSRSRPTAEPAIEEPKSKTATQWRGSELITSHQETFLELSFLHQGLRVAQSVVRVVVTNQRGAAFSGTGFLIAPDTILTNHHVLYDHKDDFRRMEHVKLWFNYEVDQRGQLRKVECYDGDVDTIDGELIDDWAIIRSKKAFVGDYPVLNLQPAKPVVMGDYVYIIQHPAGRPKKIGLLHNTVVHVSGDRIQYLTDTLPGSSGSPVCNEFWEVVALHHQGIEERVDGKYTYKNQGIHIDRVVEGLKARGIIE